LDHALADGYDSVDIRSALHLVALLQGDPKTADAQSRWSANQPATANLAGQIAEVSLQRGAIKDARAIVDKQIQQLRATGSNEPAAKTAGLFAIYEAEFGNASDSRKLAILSKTLFQGRVNLGLVALAIAINGDDTEARGISEALKRKYPSDTDERVAGALASAMLDLHANRPGNALSDLADVQRYENGANWCFEIHYVRGQAHLRNQQPSEAAADFQQIIDHRGISPSAPEWVLAHLGLARAYALQRDNAKAQAAYKEFFALWNQVDPEIPILKQAHAEFAKLQ
jgi:predicted Zn-dependent protease